VSERGRQVAIAIAVTVAVAAWKRGLNIWLTFAQRTHK